MLSPQTIQTTSWINGFSKQEINQNGNNIYMDSSPNSSKDSSKRPSSSEFMGASSGGIAFLADYIAPEGLTTPTNPVAIKIIPDDANQTAFFDNMILAVLTGNTDKDKFDSVQTRPFSYNESEHRMQCNQGGNPNLYSARINKFYEMQYNSFTFMISDSEAEKQNATVLVTRAGILDMSSTIFTNLNDKIKNTVQLLKLFEEMAEGAKNINRQHILHGDIKGANMILTLSNDGNFHLEYIDFDLMLDPAKPDEYFKDPETKDEYEINTGFDNWPSPQLRYTDGYRAPWIVEYSVQEENGQTEPEILYPYDKTFKEDAYALAATIHRVFTKNKQFVDEDNLALNNILEYTKQEIIDKAVNGPEGLPTTAQMYEKISQIIADGINKKVRKLSLDDPKPTEQLESSIIYLFIKYS